MTFPIVVPEVFDRPPRGIIPLSKGGDLVIDFRQKIDDIYTPYDPGVVVRLIIDATSQVTAIANINGFSAICKVESNITDLIPTGSIWRCVVSYPTIPTTEIVAMNGTTVRAD